jgi:putative ABC transport system permease protein
VGLLLRSFSRLLRVDPGFDSTNVLTMNVSLPTAKYADAPKQTSFFDDVLGRVSALPGVRSAAISAALPLIPRRLTPVLAEGQPEVPLAQRPFLIIEAVSPRWFESMRVSLRAGRDFTAADNAQAPKVVIVNETFARRFWPGENPLGKHVMVGRWPAPAEVIGMAADVKNRGLAEDTQAQLYLAFQQLPWGNMNLLVRAATDPRAMISAVRAQVAAVDPDQPITNVQTVDELMDGARAQPRLTLVLLGIFSGTALILTVVGLYGVLAYSVAQRRPELGVRVALGAKSSHILRLVVGQGLRLTMVGSVLGLIAALIFTRVIASFLYKTSARDLSTFVLVPLVFFVIALAASYLPAYRAARVDPTEALRGN